MRKGSHTGVRRLRSNRSQHKYAPCGHKSIPLVVETRRLQQRHKGYKQSALLSLRNANIFVVYSAFLASNCVDIVCLPCIPRLSTTDWELIRPNRPPARERQKNKKQSPNDNPLWVRCLPSMQTEMYKSRSAALVRCMGRPIAPNTRAFPPTTTRCRLHRGDARVTQTRQCSTVRCIPRSFQLYSSVGMTSRHGFSRSTTFIGGK